eukprot:762708-Hanusia_phi.AAC.9
MGHERQLNISVERLSRQRQEDDKPQRVVFVLWTSSTIPSFKSRFRISKIPEDGHRSFKIEVGFGETGKSPVVADQRYRTRTTVSDEMPDQLLIGLTDIIDDFLIKALCLHIFSVTDHPTKLFFCD